MYSTACGLLYVIHCVAFVRLTDWRFFFDPAMWSLPLLRALTLPSHCCIACPFGKLVSTVASIGSGKSASFHVPRFANFVVLPRGSFVLPSSCVSNQYRCQCDAKT